MKANRVQHEVILEAAAAVGGISKLAGLMGVHRQTVYRWLTNGLKPIRAIQMEKETGVSRRRLCPDAFSNGGR